MRPLYKNTPIPILTAPCDFGGRRPRVIFRENTEIVEALSTAEERFIGQPRALVNMRYTVQAMSAREVGYLRKTMELATATPVGVPMWTELRRLTAPAAIGATALAHTSREFLSFEGRHFLLMADPFNWEVVSGILDAGYEMLDLDEPLEAAWASGTAIVPLLFGFVARPASRAITDESGRCEIVFEERFGALQVEMGPVYLDLGDGSRLDLGDGESFLRLN